MVHLYVDSSAKAKNLIIFILFIFNSAQESNKKHNALFDFYPFLIDFHIIQISTPHSYIFLMHPRWFHPPPRGPTRISAILVPFRQLIAQRGR
jgi:hypothetical protein